MLASSTRVRMRPRHPTTPHTFLLRHAIPLSRSKADPRFLVDGIHVDMDRLKKGEVK